MTSRNPTSIHLWALCCGLTSELKTSFANILWFVQLQEVFLHKMCFYLFLSSVTPIFLFLCITFLFYYFSYFLSFWSNFLSLIPCLVLPFHLVFCYSPFLAVVSFSLISVSIYPHSQMCVGVLPIFFKFFLPFHILLFFHILFFIPSVWFLISFLPLLLFLLNSFHRFQLHICSWIYLPSLYSLIMCSH